MHVLVTGHHGYIGSVLVRVLAEGGHAVRGLDTFLYEGCTYGDDPVKMPAIRKDIRDVTAGDLRGFDAVIHLAALSNDPLGYLNERCTFEINHIGTVRLAEAAKKAGVPRFLFSSSCSLYGAAGDEMLTEDAAFNPVTAYGVSKVLAEADLSKLADETFSPTYLRNATAYGLSPRLRADIVVNNLVGHAYTTGEIVMQSDGSPWRPLVHVEDISRAFLSVLEAPRAAIHNEAFNVGTPPRTTRLETWRRSSRRSYRVPRSDTWKAPDRTPAATAWIAGSCPEACRGSRPSGMSGEARPSCMTALSAMD